MAEDKKDKPVTKEDVDNAKIECVVFCIMFCVILIVGGIGFGIWYLLAH